MIPCHACERPKEINKYLCGACWELLSPSTKRALYLNDSHALARLRSLRSQISAGVPLADIRVGWST